MKKDEETVTIPKKAYETLKEKAALLDEGREIIEGMKKERDQVENEEKQQLLFSLARDSRGYLRKDALSKFRVETLRNIRRNFNATARAHYFEIFKRRHEAKQRGADRGLTVGEYDEKSKTYKRGRP